MASCTCSSTNQDSESISHIDMNPSYIYDVFLSFCDKDAAKSFAYNLDTALSEDDIIVFRDDDELRNEDEMITPSVLQAIERSRISIVVFSKNYADSNRCIQELEKIMECYRTTNQMVVTVFHHEEGTLERAYYHIVESMCEYMNSREFDVTSWNESENIKEVVEHVTSLLDRTDLFVADHPVGVDSHVQDIIQLLNSQESKDPVLLGIWGRGGIGKTTIAKGAYNKIRHDFEAKSFLLNVSKTWEQDNGKVSLQQQLLSDIYKTTKVKIDTVESGKMILQERLSQKRIFLVLDDVNNLDQLNALCGSHKWFGQGSIIIITSRADYLLRTLKVDHVYRMKALNDDESLQLFSWHAFKEPSPIDGFADLSRDFIKYCGGLPLVLQVIGSSLLTKQNQIEWRSVLEKLNSIPKDQIFEILKISYDGLRDNDMKEIFLEIVLFFIGMNQKAAAKILKESRHFVDIGISVLVQQNLVTVDRKNNIGMHDLLREMGRDIIRENAMRVDKERIYDVFLSFRGEDCRAKFIGHLYTSLQNAGIYVFKDDDGLRRGNQISVSLLEAIGQSRICIVVLSSNYANSRWCMLELENIMEIGRRKSLVVIPVFYEVDPSEVRHQTGKFGQGFENLISRMSVDDNRKMNWKTALLEVGGTSGVVVINSK